MRLVSESHRFILRREVAFVVRVAFLKKKEVGPKWCHLRAPSVKHLTFKGGDLYSLGNEIQSYPFCFKGLQKNFTHPWCSGTRERGRERERKRFNGHQTWFWQHSRMAAWHWMITVYGSQINTSMHSKQEDTFGQTFTEERSSSLFNTDGSNVHIAPEGRIKSNEWKVEETFSLI